MPRQPFFRHGRPTRHRAGTRPHGSQDSGFGTRALPVVRGVEPDELVRLFEHSGRPLRLDDILRFLDLSRREKKTLRALLDALTAQGRLLRLSGGRWTDASQAPTIIGTLSIQRSGSGLVTPDPLDQEASPSGTRSQRGPDIFIHPLALGDAWHGDTVEVLVQPTARALPGSRWSDRAPRVGRSRGRKAGRPGSPGSTGAPGFLHPEGRILRVLRRGTRELAVHVTAEPDATGRVLCRPADSRFPFLVLADIADLPDAPAIGELLLALPDADPAPAAEPSATLAHGAEARRLWRNSPRDGQPVYAATARAAIGREDDVTVQERLVRLNHLIPSEFPANVLAEAEAAPRATGAPASPLGDPTALPFRSTAARQDLRALPFVTIDGADARDFDDAICVVRRGQGWELWVAIADVSHFVRPGSALDKEARERGNSCYFPASVSPMLPEILSNDLCSLRPDEDRLVMTARLWFSAAGAPEGAVFFPACIRSRARLTYEETQAAFDAADADAASSGRAGEAAPDLLRRFPGLGHARDLARALRARREAAGALDFELPEPEFIIDRTNGRLTAIRRRERLEAHRLIEACMLAANEAVARRLMDQGAPFPYRVHPAPDRDRLETLFRTLNAAGLIPQDMNAPRTSEGIARALGRILRDARGGPNEFLVNRLVLRAMMQARYSPEAEGHFGLASTAYCHFTSPIRRYADLMTHRALRFILDGSGPIPAGRKLLAVCDHCNARERAATEAEREISRRMGCLLLRDRVGEGFSGIISGLSPFGVFVELDAAPVEGMIRVESLDDLFDYNQERQELIGLHQGRRFRLGQRVRTRLAEVHMGRLEITLTLVPTRHGDSAPPRKRRRGASR